LRPSLLKAKALRAGKQGFQTIDFAPRSDRLLVSHEASAASYRVFARQLAGEAAKLGYVTVSGSAASLIE
jgi:hypothetical protein